MRARMASFSDGGVLVVVVVVESLESLESWALQRYRDRVVVMRGCDGLGCKLVLRRLNEHCIAAGDELAGRYR
jgi:hypothetical protein